MEGLAFALRDDAPSRPTGPAISEEQGQLETLQYLGIAIDTRAASASFDPSLSGAAERTFIGVTGVPPFATPNRVADSVLSRHKYLDVVLADIKQSAGRLRHVRHMQAVIHQEMTQLLHDAQPTLTAAPAASHAEVEKRT
jgi:hypothetical protein